MPTSQAQWCPVEEVNVRLPTDTRLPMRDGALPGFAPGRLAANAAASQPIVEDRIMSNKDQKFAPPYGKGHAAKYPQQVEKAAPKSGKAVDGHEPAKPKAAPLPQAAAASAKLSAGPASSGHPVSAAPSGEARAKPASSAARGNDDVMSTPAKKV
jgi:hypothetical protein